MRIPALLVTVAALSAASPAQDLPDGFTHDVVASGLTIPVALALLPDGRMLVACEDNGEIHVIAADGTVGPVGAVPSVAFLSHRGLTGLAVDPQWPAWPYVYVFYHDIVTMKIRIGRYTVAGDLTDPSSTNLTIANPYLLLTDIPDDHPWHNGGTLRFAGDGYLYASLGDDHVPCDSQDPTHLSGCILRLDIAPVRGATGTGPPAPSVLAAPGNPWSGNNAELMWAIGLREPFRFTVDEITGDLFISEVGGGAWEEINQCPTTGPGGMNFGWPEREGAYVAPPWVQTCGITGNFVDPIAEWPHTDPAGHAVIILAGTYRNRANGAYNFGPGYEGDIIVTDYRQGTLRRYSWNGSQWGIAAPVPGQPTPTEWATGVSRAVDGVVGPDGALYYINRSLGFVGRIRHGTGPSNELWIAAEQPGGPGTGVTVLNANLTPGVEYFNLYSTEACATGVGHGPYLGLCASSPTPLLNQFFRPLGTPGIHFIATSSTMSWGPFTTPPVMMEGVTFEWVNGTLGRVSPVTRIAVQ